MNKELREGLLEVLGAAILFLELEGTPAVKDFPESRREARKELLEGLREAVKCVKLEEAVVRMTVGRPRVH